jgi:L-lactate dehydrogenase complex protein LldG
MTTEATSSDSAERSDLLDTFAARAGALGVRVERVADGQAVASIVAGLARELDAARAIVSGELQQAVPGLTAALETAGVAATAPGDPGATRDAPLGVSLARLAVAETGSLLLAEPELSDRAVGMLAKTQCVVCPTSALVPTLDQAAATLRELALRPGGAYATFVTGPSRTADIELSLTVGVQGPAKLVVLFVDDFGSPAPVGPTKASR